MKKVNKKHGRNAFGEEAELRFVELEKATAKEEIFKALMNIAKSQKEGKCMEYTFGYKDFAPEEIDETAAWMAKAAAIIIR